LWGVIGPDPRNYDTAGGPVLLSACVNWIVDEVDDAFRAGEPIPKASIQQPSSLACAPARPG
jgi:hypothetical protein